MTTGDYKSVLLFACKLGYQTRSFDAAARNLGIRLFYVTDRCHELTNPWGDDALAVRFDAPEHAAGRALQEFRKHHFHGILGLGDRPAIAASYTARLYDKILAWPEGSSYLGFIFAKAESAKDVEDALRSAHSRLQFTIREALPVEHPVTGKMLNSRS